MDPHAGKFDRLLGSLSILTMVLTVPQVWNVWVQHEARGVSVISWAAYLVSACLWFFHGLKKKDKNIYLPCIGWIILDAAVVIGAFFHR